MPVVVQLKDKNNNKETKNFDTMEDFEDWIETSEANNYEVEKVMNEEVKASGEKSSTMAPVASGNQKNKRRADKTDQKEPMHKSRQDPNVEMMPVDGTPVNVGSLGKFPGKSSMVKEMISVMAQMSKNELEELYDRTVDVAYQKEADISDLVKEEFKDLFEGDETFSEDFKRDAFVIFESAIVTKLQEEKEKLQEEFEEKLQEEISSYEDKLNDYAKYVVNEWVEENEKSLQESIKAEMFDSLVEGVKNVFLEHNISLDENSLDIIENLNEKIENMKVEMNDISNKNIELENKIFENECELIFKEKMADLTETQKEKIAKVANSMSYESVEDFSSKLGLIKESYFSKENVSSNAQDLNEEFEGNNTETKEIPAHINAAREAIKRSMRSN